MERLISIDRYTRDYDTRKLTYSHSIYFCNGKRISLAQFYAKTFLRAKPQRQVKVAGTFFDIKKYFYL